MNKDSYVTKINGVDTRVYDIYQRERIDIPSPEQDVELIEIRGRHGALTKKNGFKDITLPVEFIFYEKGKSFKKAFNSFKLLVMNAKKLTVNNEEDLYYKVKFVEIEDAINVRGDVGEFTVNFTLDPFQYETVDSSQTITSRTTINNEGYESQPIITAHMSGTGKIYINDQEITIQNINGTIIIDSELMNAYRNNNGINENLNHHMIGDFPILKHGENVIDFDGDITKLEINPRWRWV